MPVLEGRSADQPWVKHVLRELSRLKKGCGEVSMCMSEEPFSMLKRQRQIGGEAKGPENFPPMGPRKDMGFEGSGKWVRTNSPQIQSWDPRGRESMGESGPVVWLQAPPGGGCSA